MALFILLTRLGEHPARPIEDRGLLERSVKSAVAETCGNVTWMASFAVSGPYDYLDIFDAPDTATAMAVATVVKTIAGGTTDTWMATDWKTYKDMLTTIARRGVNGIAAAARNGAGPSTKGILDGGRLKFGDLPPSVISAIAALRPTETELDNAWSIIRGEGDPNLLAKPSKTSAIYWIIAQELLDLMDGERPLAS